MPCSNNAHIVLEQHHPDCIHPVHVKGTSIGTMEVIQLDGRLFIRLVSQIVWYAFE